MAGLQSRELLQFPGGANSSDVLINGMHFNRTVLNHWNYTFWSNGTLTNESNCYLVFDQYKPVLLSNGTFLNATTCYAPINPIGTRAILGIVCACLFGASLMFTLINLRKHGRLFLPSEKRFRAIGRRWQWYWMLALGALGCISGFMSIDVDRDYLPSNAVAYQGFSYELMTPALLGIVWEAVRHWGSWNERRIIDREPFLLPQNDARGKKEFFMPLVFYLWNFMFFFMTVPRSWSAMLLQRSPAQQRAIAEPSATDGRFKAASFFAILAWLTICFSLRHSIHHYKPRNRGFYNSFVGFLRYAPRRFFLTIPLSAIKIGYDAATTWNFDISPLKFNCNPVWMYSLGYLPCLLVLLVMEVWGYIGENEDRQIIEQRREIERNTDAELGVVRKPHWWERRTDWGIRQVGGGPPTERNIIKGIEMGNLPPGRPRETETGTKTTPATARFTDRSTPAPATPPAQTQRNASFATDWSGTRTNSTASTIGTTNAPPQKVRSMLDI